MHSQGPELSRHACVTFTVDSTSGNARSGSLRFQQATRDGDAREPVATSPDKPPSNNDTRSDNDKTEGVDEMASHQGCIKTPAFLGYTRRGLPPQLTPDVLDANLPHMPLHVVTTHFLEPHPLCDAIASCPTGLSSFLSLPRRLLFSSQRDIASFSGHETSSTDSLTFDTPNGRRKVTLPQHVKLIYSFAPHLAVPLHDCPPSSPSITLNRHRRAVARSAHMLSHTLDTLPTTCSTSLLAPVVGGPFVLERQQSAKQAAAHAQQLLGFHLAGFGLGEAPQDRQQLLQAALSELPSHKLRHVSGFNTPEEVLHGITCGIDMFDTSYPSDLSALGFAMTFPLLPPSWHQSPPALTSNHTISSSPHTPATPPAAAESPSVAAIEACNDGDALRGPKEQQQQKQEGEEEEGAAAATAAAAAAAAAAAVMKLNLRCKSHVRSFIPISSTCTCFACRKHTRAYLHHMLDAHEMLALVLLDIHNYHHFSKFFCAVQSAIQSGRFEEYQAWFLEMRSSSAQLDSADVNAGHLTNVQTT